MQTPAQLTLRDGPEVLAKYKWTFISQGVTHGRHHAHDGGNGTLIVLYQATNGDHWHIDHMTDVNDRLDLVQLQQQTRNTAFVSQRIRSYMSLHKASCPLSITCTRLKRYNTNRFIAPNTSYIQH